MNEAELKQNITKIEQLLLSEDYEAGFELLITLNNSELTKALMEKIISCLVTHLKEHDIEDVLKLSMELNVLRPFQLHIGKISSIDSSAIELLYKRDDLDEATRKIVELKYSLSELHKKHLEENQGISKDSDLNEEQWISDSLLSSKDLGKDVFESLYKDKFKKLVLEVTKNPHFSEEYLTELYELHHDNIEWDNYQLYLIWIILNHSNCPEPILETASQKDEGYCSSLLRKAVALNKKSNKNIIDVLLLDKYRWVRQAAGSHLSLKKNDILKLIGTGDRYILKGLKENVNCDDTMVKNISTLLDDEEKYPLEYTTYTISEPSDPGRIGAGVIPLESIVCILTEGLAGESFPDVLDDIGEFWNSYSDFYEVGGSYEGSNYMYINDPSIHLEEEEFEFEYVEIGDPSIFEDELGKLLVPVKEYDLINFHNNEYDPSYFNNLELGTFFFIVKSFHDGTVSFDPIEQEEELNIWEVVNYYEFGIFQYNKLWGYPDSNIEESDYDKNGTLYVKDGKNSFTEIDLEELDGEVFENLGDELNEDNVTLYLKKKYSK
jgi:hypothetical protein